LELGKYKINVNAVCPGVVNAPMLWDGRKFMREHNIPDFYLALIEETPLGRIEEPEDAAKVVAFLASSDADFMTGQAINVTGGLMMAH
jgi:NAD(P)-dependent dehydrogenase (short-subunit alcohol dehydrogenase family)